MIDDETTPVETPVDETPVSEPVEEPELPTEEVEPSAVELWKASPEFEALKTKVDELRMLDPLCPHLSAIYTGVHNLV